MRHNTPAVLHQPLRLDAIRWGRLAVLAMGLLPVAPLGCDDASAPAVSTGTAARTADAPTVPAIRTPAPAGQAASPAATENASAQGARPRGSEPTRAGQAGGGPVRIGPVELSRQHVDFGVVGPNTVVEAEIQIRNVTDAPVKILASVPTCQCTTVDMAGIAIAPGESVPMPMSLKTSGSTGVRAAAVTLVFEGHDTPVQVSIRSEVAYSVRATPPFVDVQQSPRDPSGNARPPLPLTGTVSLEAVDGRPFRVLGVHGKAPRLIGFDPRVDEPRSRYEVTYDLTDAHRTNSMPHYLIIETDRADCPALELRVRHEATHLRPAFKIAEFRSTVGELAPGQVGSFELEIQEFGDRRIAEVTSKDPSVALTRLVDQKSDGKSLLITVEVVPNPSVRGLLYFMTTITAVDGAKSDLVVFGRVVD